MVAISMHSRPLVRTVSARPVRMSFSQRLDRAKRAAAAKKKTAIRISLQRQAEAIEKKIDITQKARSVKAPVLQKRKAPTVEVKKMVAKPVIVEVTGSPQTENKISKKLSVCRS